MGKHIDVHGYVHRHVSMRLVVQQRTWQIMGMGGTQRVRQKRLRHPVCLRPGGIRVGLSTEDLRRVATPTLLIWGNRDPFGGHQVARMVAAALPHSRLVELPEQGHLPWVGDPARCATEIEAFLSAPVS